MTYAELGEHIHLSANATKDRVKKLEMAGVISSYSAVIDKTKIPMEVNCYICFKLQDHAGSEVSDVFNVINQFAEVTNASKVMGSYDYVLRVTASNMGSYHVMLDELLRTFSLHNVHSFMVMDEMYPANRINLNPLLRKINSKLRVD